MIMSAKCKTLSQNCQNIQMMMNKEIETEIVGNLLL